MSRIVAGTAGGQRIAVPPNGVRPTSDRVREALFSLLEARGVLEDATVLDLYAGSGALGLEALSRGALTATLVERDPRACGFVQTNARTTGLTGALVRRASVTTFLKRPTDVVDLVFVDPPYAGTEDEVDVVLGLLVPWLSPDGLVVLERDSRTRVPAWPEGLVAEEPRVYGETTLHLGTPTG
ncbi:16S rRNA (guanine(966)-N(2))-methyltransferase RsmD [Actinomycetospora termitidis]|uniref:16S rRNA (Guanine(966)-N(2))-methyltransferase RsmD n=1 Tax=Actinomycetospora termitidis TaxID=3053470 RepID=A0ABT7M5W7_9PSEU|nr:16S rRNA (guanine(966)-N(2))-methyltransferase RsmD [Actinomycetospora sp. Odt1-22]MDL5155943.1 16S rRNA (guanine(966)-N(2))-methyltransferase RsmD [Actinomycetospora sp. Odt1-22]